MGAKLPERLRLLSPVETAGGAARPLRWDITELALLFDYHENRLAVSFILGSFLQKSRENSILLDISLQTGVRIARSSRIARS
ncbi:unnamed protein product [Plutella xylostella]|uniref:(diamondback moth) hypothetical protein n=1 Tax=Plutella xylostella TaxID=51655 RepID=A0A8S4CXJ7_PLUXY|nr:unnamed protein product [Plutella xylostella]